MRRIKLWMLLALLTAAALLLTGCACKHEETTLVNIVNATCTEDGYSGDVQCTSCNEIIREGVVVPATGHTPGEPEGAAEPTCTEDGVTDTVKCAVCGEVITAGEAIPATGHTPGEPEGAAEPTCTEDGATGTISCTVCGEVITESEAIPATGHTPGEPEGTAEPTCTEDGATGTVSCTVCGEVVTESEAIPAGHDFADHVCTRCAWREPGLYVEGELVKTWDELEADGTVTVAQSDRQLAAVKGDLQMGVLVIGEDVAVIGSIRNNTVTEIWVPATVTRILPFIAYGNTSVTTIHLYCRNADVSNTAFRGMEALEEVIAQ